MSIVLDKTVKFSRIANPRSPSDIEVKHTFEIKLPFIVVGTYVARNISLPFQQVNLCPEQHEHKYVYVYGQRCLSLYQIPCVTSPSERCTRSKKIHSPSIYSPKSPNSILSVFENDEKIFVCGVGKVFITFKDFVITI